MDSQRIAKLEEEITSLRQEVGRQHTKDNELQTQMTKLEEWKTDTEVDWSDYTIQEKKALWSALLLHIPTVVVFPVYKTIFRQQIHNIPVCEAVRQLCKEGKVNMFRGVLPALRMRKVRLISYTTQENLVHLLSSSPITIHPSTRPALAGLGAGVVEAIISAPFERVQNVLQNREYNSSMAELRRVLERLGRKRLVFGFYRAFLPMAARNALGSGLFFGLKGPLYEAVEAKGLPPMASSFVSGTLTSMYISFALYPLSVLVANMQARVGGEWAGATACWWKLWDSRQQRVALLYRGFPLVMLRSCISWGIANVVLNEPQRGSGRYAE